MPLRKVGTLLLGTIAFAQNPNPPVFPSNVATDTHLMVAKNSARTTLAASVSSTATTLSVTNASALSYPSIVKIDNELINICSFSGNVVQVCTNGRGFDGTVASSHNSGATVEVVVAAHYHNQLAAEIKAIEQTLGANLSNVTIDASQVISGTFANARVSQSSVTQHQAALQLDASQIVSGALSKSRLPSTTVYTDQSNTWSTGTQAFDSSLVIPRKSDPASPAVGEAWINVDRFKFRTNEAAPRTLTAVDTTRSVLTGSGLSGGGDLSQDRTLSVVPDSTVQKVETALSGTLVGTRKQINFIPGSNVSISALDNPASNRVDVTISSSGGAGGGDITAVGTCTTGDCFTAEPANRVLASPDATSGAISARALVPNDIPGLPASKITSGTFADARIAQSNVTQHQSALQLDASQIISGTFTKPRLPAVTAYTDQANAWTSGVQSFDSALVLPRKADPASPSVGEAWINTNLFKFRTNEATPRTLTLVDTTRQIIAGTGLTGGGDFSADRTLSVVPDTTTQKVEVAHGGVLQGTRKRINFIAGTNVSLSVADNSAANAVDVTISSTGGGGGGTASTPMDVTLTNATTLSIGSNCSITQPCILRVGAVTFNFTAAATATLTSGSGTARIYLNGDGTLSVGLPSSGMSVTCTGCTTVLGVNSFPTDSLPIYEWVASSGQWASSGTDRRSILSAGRRFQAGSGITVSEAGNVVTISAIGGGGGSGGYSTVQDEGTSLAQRSTLNFTGGGVSCTDDSANARTNCVVPDVLGGDVTGTFGNSTVARLQGRNVANVGPSDGQALVWNAGANQWQPGAASITGDVTGNLAASTVTKLQGRNVASTAPSDGQVLTWSATATQWEPKTMTGGTGGVDLALSEDVFWIRDDFWNNGAQFLASSSAKNGATCSTTSIASGKFRGIRTTVGGTPAAGHSCQRGLYAGSGAVVFPNLGAGGDWTRWDIVYILRSPSAPADVKLTAGLHWLDGNAFDNAVTPGMAFLFDPTNARCSTGGSTVNWVAATWTASAAITCIDTGVAYTANTIYKMHIWSDSPGTVKFDINDGTVFSSSTNVTTNEQLGLVYSVHATGTASVSIDMDFAAAKIVWNRP